jgi:phosphogluconate dehydratase
VNHFHAAGGMAFVIRELLGAGLLHGTCARCGAGARLHAYTQEPWLDDGKLAWREGAGKAAISTCCGRRAIPSAPMAD